MLFLFIVFAMILIGFLLIISFYISCAKKLAGGNSPAYRLDILKMTVANIFLLIFVAAACFVIGYKNAYDHFEEQAEGISYSYETFYAEILGIDEGRISVRGLDVNEIAYQGEFILTPYGEAALEREGHAISISDLQPGQIISVMLLFTDGEEEDVSNNELSNIVKIEILHDKSNLEE